MGSHTFTWAHPAQDVYVTGTFDNWSKSVKLEQHGTTFHKTVDLPAEKTFYKFVVDGTWTTDSTANHEMDPSGNLNNVLQSHEIKSAPSSASFLSSAAPQSTTAALAGAQPLEKDIAQPAEKGVSTSNDFPMATPGDDLPGAFPQTPMNDLKQFSVNPIPATEGAGNPIKLAPGEPVPHPSTFTSNTVDSTVRSDPELKANKAKDETEQAFGVAPIPATGGIGNPIKLAAGEPVPHPSTLTANTVNSTVRDGSQYGISDTGAPVLPPVLGSQEEAEANGASMFGIPSVGSGVIPESSLPMGGASREPSFEPSFTTSSVAPHSTTAQLAGQVPLEPRGVPQVVSDSQKVAHVGPEAASSAAAVEDKKALEQELKEKVPEEPSTAESAPVTGVPDVVSDSQQTAHAAPEAAASPEAVREKAAVEQELQQKVPKESSTSDSIIPEAVAGGAAAAGATLIGAALLAKDKASEAYTSATAPASSAKEVPDVVTESHEAAHASPEASASPVAVSEKAQFEDELKKAVPEAPATSESGLLGNSEAGFTGKLAAGATAAGAAVVGAAYLAKDKAADAYESAAGQPASNIISEPTVDGSVPATVTESQEKAHVPPEAAANPEAVREKTAFENELQSEVSKAPATSESGAFGKSEHGISEKATAGIAAGTAALGATAAGAAYAARDKATNAYESATGQPTSSSITSEPTFNDSVPTTVTESQEKAHFSPEAAANPEAVHEKSAFEKELKSEVPEAPATSESGVFGKSEHGMSEKAAAGIAAGTAAVGATAAGAAYAARDKAASATGRDPNTILPASVQSAIDDMNKRSLPEGSTYTSSAVPPAVVDSQHEAHVSPEASAEPEAVAEKSQMEKELLNRVPATNEVSDPAPTQSAALSETAPVKPTAADSSLLGGTGRSAPTSVVPVTEEPAVTGPNSTTGAATGVVPVTGVPPVTGASSIPEASSSKQAIPSETSATATSGGLNAPADSQAQTISTKADQLSAPTSQAQLSAPNATDSRDVSPMTRPDSQPQTTTGVDSNTVPSTSTPATTAPSTPQKAANKRTSGFFRNTPESVRTSNSEASRDTEGKPKKRGFLAKLKEKFKA